MTHFGVARGLTVMSKSLAAGIPLSAVTGRAEVMDGPQPKELGGTLACCPLGCVAALAVIETMQAQELVDRARWIGEHIRATLNVFSQKIGEVRGIGAMNAIEFVTDRASRLPDPEFTKRVVHRCYERGVMTLTAGPRGNVMRLLPPLVITDDQLSEALFVLIDVIQQLETECACNG